MRREFVGHYSGALNREMHMVVYGETGVPMLVFPCQDGMSNNWESFQMHEELSGYIEAGQIQLFCVDSVDTESWSDKNGDKEHRAWMQEQYVHYIADEAVPFIMEMNGTGRLPIVTGCSLGASHAAILFFRYPQLFSGVLAFSGCYSTADFWDGWSNGILYQNSPVDFLRNMPADHPYIDLYNQKRMVLCVGQGRWEGVCLTTSIEMKEIFEQKGIHGWVDMWGYDVDHDWPWWKKQIHYHLPAFLD